MTTLDLGSFLLANQPLPDNPQPGPNQLALFPSGTVELFEEDDIFMDEDSASIVIDQFNDRGVKIPIDYEHSTKFKAAQGEQSPAAGWITAFAWDESEGLIATVEWGARARAQIKAGEYKYLSPHFRIDTESRRVDHVLAVALTNTPLFKNMRELVAASLAAGAKTMTKKKKTLLERVASAVDLGGNPTEDEVVAAVEEVVAQEPAAEEVAEEVVDELAEAAGALRAAMVAAGIIAEEATVLDAIAAAMEMIQAAEGEPAPEAMASIAASLNLKGNPSVKKIVKTINERTATSTPNADVTKLKEEVASLQSDRDELKKEKEEREVTTLIGSLVEEGKINPNDDDRMEWARTQARKDREAFTELMAGVDPIYRHDQETPNEAAPSARKKVITAALSEYANDAYSGNKTHYVNAALDEKGMEHLTDDDKKAHAIA